MTRMLELSHWLLVVFAGLAIMACAETSGTGMIGLDPPDKEDQDSDKEDQDSDKDTVDVGPIDDSAMEVDTYVEPDTETVFDGTRFSAFWANSGEDKVPQEDLRASKNPSSVINSRFDGETIKLFGARNEVVAFNLVLEAEDYEVTGVEVELDALLLGGADSLTSKEVSGDGVFNWIDREIELFYTRYLKIEGMSVFAYSGPPHYDERHLPKKFRRPYTGAGFASGTWSERPDAGKHYPDIAVPLELEQPFDVSKGTSQSIWADIYIPDDALPGLYQGWVKVREDGVLTKKIPVELEVLGFKLPESPTIKTMLVISYGDMNQRYVGQEWPNSGTAAAQTVKTVHNRHFQVAHRHKISLIDENAGPDPWGQDAPRPAWEARLDGSLFSATSGYDGPGVNTGNDIFAVGLYGIWGWKGDGEAAMRSHTDNWVNWFNQNAPDSEYFLYLVDEPSGGMNAEITNWTNWIKNNPGPGQAMQGLVTTGLVSAQTQFPNLDIPCTVGEGVYYPPETWEAAMDYYRANDNKKVYMYNGRRPWSGSFATEDDGVSLRVTAWTQYKHEIDRWFYWASTNYVDREHGNRFLDLFGNAQTFGGYSYDDPALGKTGHMYGNGDGVLFYPGTETEYPEDSYGVKGPLASLRLKFWRRGIQDGDYLKLAAAKNPARVAQIIEEILPKSMWEYGVDDVNDPSWVRTDVSWDNDPDVWDAARAELAEIITTP